MQQAGAETGALFEKAKRAARRMSDWQLEMGRMLLDVERSGEWRETYPVFEDYVVTELGLLPGSARELMRVLRKVEAIYLAPDEASAIGYGKLRAFSSKIYPGNSKEVLEDLKANTILDVRTKYCPSRPRKPRPSIAGSGAKPTCHERDPRGDCGTIEASLAAQLNALSRVTQESGSDSEPDQMASLCALDNSSTEESSSQGEQESAPRMILVTECMSVALNVAKQRIGPSSDEFLFTFICSAFIMAMGSADEKSWMNEQFPRELARRRATEAQLSSTPDTTRDAAASAHPNPPDALPPPPPVDIALDVEALADNGS